MIFYLLTYRHPLDDNKLDSVFHAIQESRLSRSKSGYPILLQKILQNREITDQDLQNYKALMEINDSEVLFQIEMWRKEGEGAEEEEEEREQHTFTDEDIKYLKNISKISDVGIKGDLVREFLNSKVRMNTEGLMKAEQLSQLKDKTMRRIAWRVHRISSEIAIDVSQIDRLGKVGALNNEYFELITDDLLDNNGRLSDELFAHLQDIKGLNRDFQKQTFKNYQEKEFMEPDTIKLWKKISKIKDGYVANLLIEKLEKGEVGMVEINYCLYVSNTFRTGRSRRGDDMIDNIIRRHFDDYFKASKGSRKECELGEEDVEYIITTTRSGEMREFLQLKIRGGEYNGDIKKIRQDYPIEMLEEEFVKIKALQEEVQSKKSYIYSILEKYLKPKEFDPRTGRELPPTRFEDLEKKKLSTKDTNELIKVYEEVKGLMGEINPEFIEYVLEDGGSGLSSLGDISVYLLNALHAKSSEAREQIRNSMPPLLLMAGVRNNMKNYSATNAQTGELAMESGLLPSTVQHSIALLTASLEKEDGSKMTIEEMAKKYKLSHKFVVEYLTLALNSTGDKDVFETFFTGNSEQYNKDLINGLLSSMDGSGSGGRHRLFGGGASGEKMGILANGLIKLIEQANGNPQTEYIVKYVSEEVEKKYNQIKDASASETKTIYKLLSLIEDKLPQNIKDKLAKDEVFLAIKEDKEASEKIDFNVQDTETKEDLEKTAWYKDLQEEEWFIKAKKAKGGRPLFTPNSFLGGNPQKFMQPIITKIYDVQRGQNISINVARYTGDERFTRHYGKARKGMGYKVDYIHDNKTYPAELVVLSKRASNGRLMIRVEQAALPSEKPDERGRRGPHVDLEKDLQNRCVQKIELAGHVNETFDVLEKNSHLEVNPDMTKIIADRGCGNAYRSHGEGRKMGETVQVIATNIKGENYKQNVIFAIQEEILAENAGREITHEEIRRKTEAKLIAKGYNKGEKSVLGYYRGMLVYSDEGSAQAQRADVVIGEHLEGEGGVPAPQLASADSQNIRELLF